MALRHSRVLTVVALVLVAACGASGPHPAATSLPLQARGLAVGGDVQSLATDVIKTRITEAQAEQIAAACNEAVEIAAVDGDCARVLHSLLISPRPCFLSQLCVHVFDVSRVSEFAEDGIIQIVDDRPATPLCDRRADGLCLQVGVKTSALLQYMVASTTPSETTTVTTSPTSTDPTSVTPSVTSSPTPDPTSVTTPGP